MSQWWSSVGLGEIHMNKIGWPTFFPFHWIHIRLRRQLLDVSQSLASPVMAETAVSYRPITAPKKKKMHFTLDVPVFPSSSPPFLVIIYGSFSFSPQKRCLCWFIWDERRLLQISWYCSCGAYSCSWDMLPSLSCSTAGWDGSTLSPQNWGSQTLVYASSRAWVWTVGGHCLLKLRGNSTKRIPLEWWRGGAAFCFVFTPLHQPASSDASGSHFEVELCVWAPSDRRAQIRFRKGGKQAWINNSFELWIFDHTRPIFSFNLNRRRVKKRDEATVYKVPKPDEGCSRGALVTTEGVDAQHQCMHVWPVWSCVDFFHPALPCVVLGLKKTNKQTKKPLQPVLNLWTPLLLKTQIN